MSVVAERHKEVGVTTVRDRLTSAAGGFGEKMWFVGWCCGSTISAYCRGLPLESQGRFQGLFRVDTVTENARVTDVPE